MVETSPGEHYTLIRSGKLKNYLVVGTAQSDVLNTNPIEAGLAAAKSPQDAVVEIFVRQKAKHQDDPSPFARASKCSRNSFVSGRDSILSRVCSASASRRER